MSTDLQVTITNSLTSLSPIPGIAWTANVDEQDFDCRWDHLQLDENRTQACPIFDPQGSVLSPTKISSVAADMRMPDLVLEVEQDVLNLPNSLDIRREQTGHDSNTPAR